MSPSRSTVDGHAGQRRGGGHGRRLVIEDGDIDLERGRSAQDAGQPPEIRRIQHERGHDPDSAGTATGQVHRLDLGDESQGICGRQYPGPGLRTDPFRLVHDVRHGGDGYPGAFRDFVDGDPITGVAVDSHCHP